MNNITNHWLAIMDKLRSMEIFVAVVDTGNFTAAAASFDISPVMVGKHIAQLEATLGARLLTRTTRRQSLTEIGRQYVDSCRAILAQIAAAESGAEAMRSVPRTRRPAASAQRTRHRHRRQQALGADLRRGAVRRQRAALGVGHVEVGRDCRGS
jgi:DNA-binding transcriptional LysR family regulator